MRTAVVHAGMAGALWGAVIVVPSLIADVHPVMISCVRFLLYGLVAILIALPRLKPLFSRLNRRDLWLLLELALTGNILYFVLLTAAVQQAGVPVASLINGLIPVAIMLMSREFLNGKPGPMLMALALVCAGVAWINLPALLDIIQGQGSADKSVGALCAGLGVVCWSWFALRNARQLKTGRFSPRDWSTLQGVATGLLAMVCTLGIVLWQPDMLPTDLPAERLAVFGLGALFMAVGGSWVANALWNSASQRLPVSVGGQMIVFETLCALLYSYLLAWTLPNVHEVVGIMLVLGGVFWTLNLERVRAANGLSVKK